MLPFVTLALYYNLESVVETLAALLLLLRIVRLFCVSVGFMQILGLFFLVL